MRVAAVDDRAALRSRSSLSAGRQYWGQGLATEAARASRGTVSSDSDCRGLICVIDPGQSGVDQRGPCASGMLRREQCTTAGVVSCSTRWTGQASLSRRGGRRPCPPGEGETVTGTADRPTADSPKRCGKRSWRPRTAHRRRGAVHRLALLRHEERRTALAELVRAGAARHHGRAVGARVDRRASRSPAI